MSGGGHIHAASSNYSAWGAPAGMFYDLNGNVLSLPRYAFRTDYVPRTGPAIVHHGECIIPAGQNAAASAPVIVIDGITISRPNVTRVDDNDALRGVLMLLNKISGASAVILGGTDGRTLHQELFSATFNITTRNAFVDFINESKRFKLNTHLERG
jgi:hypothetical protein